MLQIKQKSSDKRPLWLVDAKYTLGRDANCDIQVDDPSVAQQQAELKVSVDVVTIHNLGEPERVSVNGAFVSAPLRLAHGDEVKVGMHEFELVDPKLGRPGGSLLAADEELEEGSGWSLKAKNTALANKSFLINSDVVIGRSNDCDITLGVAHLSRKHARLYFNGAQLEVEDLHSSNGTYVNGKQVHRSFLRPGDELSLDTLSFNVQGPESEEDVTHLRVRDDIEKTHVRPAIKIDDIQSRIKAQKPARQGATKQSAGNQSAQQYNNGFEEEGSGNAGPILLALVIVALVSAAIWYFLA